MPLLSVGTAPLDLPSLVNALTEARERVGADGAIAVFVGVVRNHHEGRRVRFLEYEAYEPLARRVFDRITDEIGGRWPGVQLALHHRLGRIEIGEASVIVAAASPHRGDAFAACRYAIERVKQVAPIWKCEFFDEGKAWVEGATADPDDAQARAIAERVACA